MTENLELREWIAVNVMGYHVEKRLDAVWWDEYTQDWRTHPKPTPAVREPNGPEGQIGRWRELPPYELTWNDAALVVEAMRARGYMLRLMAAQNGDGYEARFWVCGGPVGDWPAAPTAPLAICLAAKAAIEGAQ